MEGFALALPGGGAFIALRIALQRLAGLPLDTRRQAAVNEGLRAAQALAETKMGPITGGLGGGLGALGG